MTAPMKATAKAEMAIESFILDEMMRSKRLERLGEGSMRWEDWRRGEEKRKRL